jgi:hypothetical protein
MQRRVHARRRVELCEVTLMALEDISPYSDRIGTIDIIEDVDENGTLFRTTGMLIAVIGQNLLFEKKDGRRFLVNPATASRIIEIRER